MEPEAEAIQKLSLPHPWFDPFLLLLIFRFKFIDFEKLNSNSLTLKKLNSNSYSLTSQKSNSNSSITCERIQIQTNPTHNCDELHSNNFKKRFSYQMIFKITFF